MSDRPVRRVSRFANNQVWAIREATLDIMVEVLRMRAAGITLSKEEIQARIGAAASPGSGQRGAVAVLPLYGVIAPKMNAMTEISGGTSLDVWLSQFRAFRDDASISAIVFNVDSPGGSAFGVPEAFAEIFKARDIKPIVAVVNPECGSAALWIAAAAGEIICTPSGDIGSLGVFVCHEDWSKANDMMGMKPTYIKAGEYKTEGNSDEPLSDDTVAYYQGLVDTIYADFLKAVAKGRGVTVAKAKADFGQGRMLLAKDALAAGLIDRIGTLEETVARLSSGKTRSTMSAAALAPALEAAQVQTEEPSTPEPTTAEADLPIDTGDAERQAIADRDAIDLALA
jgi:signal peptide peptidase SppA